MCTDLKAGRGDDARLLKKRRAPIWRTAAADIMLAAFFLLLFAYIHHGRAFLRHEMTADLSAAAAMPTAAAAPDAGETAAGFPAGTFADGEPVQTDTSFKSRNVSVSWSRVEDDSGRKPVVYYLADIYLRSPEYLCTALSTDGYEEVSRLASGSNAIIAINGDYSVARPQGPIVRNGQLIRDTPFGDVLVMYGDGSMKTFSADEFDMGAEAAKVIVNVWSFGPALLDADGRSKTTFDTTVAGENPRSAIGYYEPGHYCLVAVDGRDCEGSRGYKIGELAALFEKLGCAAAYNLDGGQSSVMAWDLGQTIINSPSNGGRPVGDIIYVPKI